MDQQFCMVRRQGLQARGRFCCRRCSIPKCNRHPRESSLFNKLIPNVDAFYTCECNNVAAAHCFRSEQRRQKHLRGRDLEGQRKLSILTHESLLLFWGGYSKVLASGVRALWGLRAPSDKDTLVLNLSRSTVRNGDYCPDAAALVDFAITQVITYFGPSPP